MSNSGDDIIRRIEGLLSKADSTEFDAERDALLAKADELIIKYQIDQAALFMNERREEVPIIKELWTDNPYEVNKGILLHIVAEHYGCRTIQFRRSERGASWRKSAGARRRQIVGFADDVALTEFVWGHLVIQIESMMSRDWRIYESEHPYAHTNRKTWSVNYWDGFSYRVGKRLAESMRQVIDNAAPDYLPVLASKEEKVDAAMPPNLRKGTAIQRTYNSAGRSAGDAAGSRADIGQKRVGRRGELGQ